MRLVNGYQISQALHVAATLGIADLLKDGARSSDDLAAAVGAHPQALYRLLRALAAVGVFHEDAAQGFALTSMGECLCSDAADPVGPFATFIGRPYFWQAWSQLLHSVRTGENAFRSTHGVDVWEYRASNAAEGAIFDAAMTALSRGVAEAAVAAYDFSPFARILDVGGGHGALLGGTLAANPDAHGLLLDQPHVVAKAAPILSRLGIAPPNEGPADKLSDLNMLVAPGGQERTATEFAALFAAAGLRLAQVIPTPTRMSLIEGVCT